MQIMLLTGCASGIGRHLAETLGRAGHRLVVTDIDDGAVRAAFAGFPARQVLPLRLDVRDPAAWEAALDAAEAQFGPPDVVMNIAGYLRPGAIHETPVEEIGRHLDVNARGVALGTRAAAVRMVRRGQGHIINIGSLASLAPVPGLSLYSASKFAVRGFSLAAAEDLRPHGVYVTVVCPDAVQTPMLDLQVDYPEAALTFAGPRPLSVDEVARVIVEDVLVRRPLEVVMPRGRGLLARIATLAPGLMGRLLPIMLKKGQRAQERRRRDSAP